jgi:hypothetical protein
LVHEHFEGKVVVDVAGVAFHEVRVLGVVVVEVQGQETYHLGDLLYLVAGVAQQGCLVEIELSHEEIKVVLVGFYLLEFLLVSLKD